MDGYEYEVNQQINSQQSSWENNYTSPCGCPRPWPHDNGMPCVLNQPMGIVIGPEGIHLSCPAHPAGHHIYGTQITC